MKKLVIATMLLMGPAMVFAGTPVNEKTEVVTDTEAFVPTDIKNLPDAIQKAIAKNYAGSTIKEAAVETKQDETKTYKVVLTDKEGKENTVFFKENGEILK